MLFNNAGGNVPSTNFGDFTWEMWTKRGRGEPERDVPVRQRRVPHDARPDAAGRAHHQQRLDLGACAAAGFGAYTSTKHAVTGLTKSIALDGRQYDICSGQIDIGNAATPMTARSTNGQMQPYGQMAVEPRMDVNHVGAQVAFMANLPLESNVQFVTIMATKMPFIGRG